MLLTDVNLIARLKTEGYCSYGTSLSRSLSILRLEGASSSLSAALTAMFAVLGCGAFSRKGSAATV